MKRLILILLLLQLCACTATRPSPSPEDQTVSPENIRRVHELVLAAKMPETPLIMRHMIRLQIQGEKTDLTFNGIMRLDLKTQTARVVGMGGFGLKMFDLTISPHTLTTHFLHPAIARISHASDRIAFCIRRIWLGYGPDFKDRLDATDAATLLVGNHANVLLTHRFVHDTRVSTTARGTKEFWHILFGNRSPSTHLPQTIKFFDDKNAYSLLIKLIHSKEIGPTT